MLFPEIDGPCTEPVGETCTERLLLEDVVIWGEAVVELLALVCGTASAGTSKELKTIMFAHVMEEAIVVPKLWSIDKIQLQSDTR